MFWYVYIRTRIHTYCGSMLHLKIQNSKHSVSNVLHFIYTYGYIHTYASKFLVCIQTYMHTYHGYGLYPKNSKSNVSNVLHSCIHTYVCTLQIFWYVHIRTYMHTYIRTVD